MTVRVRAAALTAVLLCLAVAFAGDTPVARAAWARATPPGVVVGAAYLTITGGAANDTLTAARLDGVASVEFHETTTEGGVARMRQSPQVSVPAHRDVAFAPSGRHLMLIDLERPLVVGEKRPLVLVFEHAGEVSVDLEVRAANAAALSDR